MHILNALSVMDSCEMEWFHNIIANVFGMILVYTSMYLPHALSQIKPKILIEVNALVQYQVGISAVIKPIFPSPSLELLHG